MFVYLDTCTKCNEEFIDQICIIHRPEETKLKQWLMVVKEVSVNVKTGNTFKYDNFPGFLLYLKNA